MLSNIDFKEAIITIPSEAKENMTTMNGKKQETDACHYTFV